MNTHIRQKNCVQKITSNTLSSRMSHILVKKLPTKTTADAATTPQKMLEINETAGKIKQGREI